MAYIQVGVDDAIFSTLKQRINYHNAFAKTTLDNLENTSVNTKQVDMANMCDLDLIQVQCLTNLAI